MLPVVRDASLLNVHGVYLGNCLVHGTVNFPPVLRAEFRQTRVFVDGARYELHHIKRCPQNTEKLSLSILNQNCDL